MVKVSVIVSIYNSQSWLKECLESLSEQLFSDCEFVCVDDGSKDDSYKIVEEYEKKDKRFTLIRQENKGLAEARNVGIRNAKGKYIAFLDADDCLQDKNALSELYETAENTAADFVTFDADCFYESDILQKTSDRGNYYIRKKEYGVYPSGRELFCEMIENEDFCDGAWVLFVKRDWILSYGLWFVPRLNPEDCIWSFMCYMHAGRVGHIKKRFYRYRIRDDSLTTEKISFAVIYGRIYTVREMLKFMLTNELSEREERAICVLVDIILWHMKDKFQHLEIGEAHRLQELSPVDSLVARYMNYPALEHMKSNKLLYAKGFRQTLLEAPGVIIYGAGKIGRLVYQYMKKEQLMDHFRSFAISDYTSESGDIEGHRIRWICDEALERTDLVIVAVTKRYQKEMIHLAKESGFPRILPVDEYLSYILEEFYG